MRISSVLHRGDAASWIEYGCHGERHRWLVMSVDAIMAVVTSVNFVAGFRHAGGAIVVVEACVGHAAVLVRQRAYWQWVRREQVGV